MSNQNCCIISIDLDPFLLAAAVAFFISPHIPAREALGIFDLDLVIQLKGLIQNLFPECREYLLSLPRAAGVLS